MKDQHKKIKGYRDLSRQEIDDMNDIKAEGETLDQAMVTQAENHLKIGIMLAVRAVAQPESF